MLRLTCLLSLLCCAALLPAADGKHLFILSGQSNMARLDPARTFTPAVTKAFGKENIIVVKDAKGGQPIRRWYKEWEPARGRQKKEEKNKNGDLYDQLMKKVREARGNDKIASITFLWMQGERDAREKQGTVYDNALTGLVQQLKDDLQRFDVNVVIGRLSDFDMDNKQYPHWIRVRKAQEAVLKKIPRSALVNTDDLNDVKQEGSDETVNDLHYTKEGYDEFGKRLAAKAIFLIKNNTTSIKPK